MIIKIDNREQELIKLCKHYIEIIPNYKDLELIVEALPLGDVILCKDGLEKIIVERKGLGDLSSSIKDGRYEEQSYRLNGMPHHNHNIMYLIEGDLTKTSSFNSFKDRVDKTTLYSAMFSLNYYKGFSVLRSMSTEESALIICNMAYKLNKTSDKQGFYSNTNSSSNTFSLTNGEQQNQNSSEGTEQPEKEDSYCNVIKKVKKENITPENIGEIMLCQIPGISSTSAIALMKEFKTIQNLVTKINESETCLKDISYTNAKGQTRRINKTVIANIIKFLKG
jgi:ERCC4-type nuclease